MLEWKYSWPNIAPILIVFVIVEVGNIQPLFSSISEDFSFSWFSYKTIPLWSRRKTISLFQEAWMEGWASVGDRNPCLTFLLWHVLQVGCLCLCVLVYLFYRWPVFVPWCICALLSSCPYVLMLLYLCLFVSLCLAVFVFTVTGQTQAFSDLRHSIIRNEEQSCTLRTKRERSSARRKTRRNSRCEILNLKNKCHPLLTSLRRSNCP